MEQIKIALSQFGTKGIYGPLHNDEVMKFYLDIGAKWVEDDDIAWCAGFTQWVCKKANLPYNSKLNARSFLEWGRQTEKPELGDIVVLWRISKASAFGHVGFYINETANAVNILGGNQSNSVNISTFPKTQVLQYRTMRK